MKSFFNFISSRKVISIIVIIFLCGMLVAKIGSNQFPENEMDNRSVPNLIDYQGKITDDSNNPITDPVSIVFAIYDIDTGGTALWTETHTSVTPVDGLVHVLLGSVDTFGTSLFDGSDLWLGINVNSDGEMTPRLRIVSVPYAIHSKTADTDNDWTINGSDMYSAVSGDVGIGTTTPGYKLDVDGDFRVTGILHDSAGNAGTSGQVLSTTGSGTDWVDATDEINDLTDGKTGGYSVFLGSGAGANDDSTDNYNVGVGNYALNANTDGNNNTASGYQALYTNSTGYSNTANGAHTLHYNTGSYNAAFGVNALYYNTSGEGNVGIGLAANAYNQEGSNNTTIGYMAGMGTSLHNKSGNIFLGYLAGYNETGDNKLYIENSLSTIPLIYGEFDNDYVKINGGFEVSGTLYDDDHDAGTSGQVLSTTGSGTDWVDAISGDGHSLDAADGDPTDVVYVDNDGKVGINDTTPSYQLDVDGEINISSDSAYKIDGADILQNRGTGNIFVGDDAGHYNSGHSNAFIGVAAGTSNTDGKCNVFLGKDSGQNNTTGNYNSYLGSYSGYLSTGEQSIFIGSYSGYNTTGSNNVFLGFEAGYDETGSDKLYIESSRSSTPLIYGEFDNDFVKINGNFEVAGILYDDDHDAGTSGQVLSSTSTGTDWVDANIGAEEIDDLQDGKSDGSSVFLGSGAGTSDDSSDNKNVGVGIDALSANTSGIYNTANGYRSLFSNIVGNYNTANGNNALGYNTGSYNTAFGSYALNRNTIGEYNIGIGMDANRYNQEGSYNTIIGYKAGMGASLHNKSGNIFLGYRAGYYETESNKLYIENSISSSPLIYGEFDNDYVEINGDFKVTGILYDDDHDAGTSGQVLSSTGSGTDWVDENVGAEEINDLTDGKTGGNSVFLGSNAGANDDGTDNNNVGIGISALFANISGIYNTANGYDALHYNTGSHNTAFGSYALSMNTSGEYNVGIGIEVNAYNEEGSNNTILGYQAGRGTVLHNKSGNIFLGFQAGYGEIGDNKLYIENSWGLPLIYGEFDNDYVRINGDFQATGELRDSDDQPGTSGQVLSSTGSGTNWVDAATGDITAVTAGTGLTGGGTSGDITLNVDLAGSGSATTVSRSDHNHEIDDLTDGKTGGNSVFLGPGAGTLDDGSDNRNVGVGIDALYTNSTGYRNTANGYQALSFNSTGKYNTANGYHALHYNTGSRNTAFGSSSLSNNTSGEYNVGIGYQANCFNQQGSRNTMIGYLAGSGTSLHNKSGNIFLGYYAGYSEDGDNKLYIDNSSDSTPLIYGDFSTDKVTINDVLKLAPRYPAPSNPTEGELYVNGSNHHIYCYLNGVWKQLD